MNCFGMTSFLKKIWKCESMFVTLVSFHLHTLLHNSSSYFYRNFDCSFKLLQDDFWQKWQKKYYQIWKPANTRLFLFNILSFIWYYHIRKSKYEIMYISSDAKLQTILMVNSNHYIFLVVHAFIIRVLQLDIYQLTQQWFFFLTS